MSTVLAKPPRAEGLVVGLLATWFTSRGYVVNTTGATLNIGVVAPTSAWTASSVPFLQVALDGITSVRYPILWNASVRITAWAFATTVAQDLAALCEARLLSGVGGGTDVFGFRSLTGVQVAKDPATGAQLATISVRANLKGVVFA